MRILATIAWRNIWRNRRRSWVLITAIAVGVFCFVGSMTFMDGFSIQMVNTAIELEGGHIRVAAEGYQENPTIRTRIGDVEDVQARISDMSMMQSAPQVITPGMVNSSEQAAGVRVIGVDPDREDLISSVPQLIGEGEYLSPERGNEEVVIGAALADRLNVRLGEKIVIMVSDLDNNVSAGAYRIRGLYMSNSSEFDKVNVFVHIGEARRLLGYGDAETSALTMRLDRGVPLEEITATLSEKLADLPLEVVTWRDRSPVLVLMRDTYDIASFVLVIILFAAISFSIINSFLMVIFERIREIGIMSANGLRPHQVRWMLYLEAVFIVFIGLAVGGLFSAGMITVWLQNGLDLSAFAEGVRSFGIGTVIYPFIDWGHLLSGTAMIFVMVLLSVLYPAFKASRFGIVEAINYV